MINQVQAALSAKTIKAIQGSVPYFSISSGEKMTTTAQLLGFTMPRRDGKPGYESINASISEVIGVPSKDSKFNDMRLLVPADGKPHPLPIYYGVDDDGDKINNISGTMTAAWYDKGELVTDLNKILLMCGGPYELKVDVSAVTVTTKYGTPNSYNYIANSKVYNFQGKGPGICYIRPLSMVANIPPPIFIPRYKDGYNPSVWTREMGSVGRYEHKGFSVSKMRHANKIFPTVAFDKAQFYIVGSEDNPQNRYRCLANSNWIKLSGQASEKFGANCLVTIDSKDKPKEAAIINFEYQNSNGEWKNVDTYKIDIPKKWAIGETGHRYQVPYDHYGDFRALDRCRRMGPRADFGKTDQKQAMGLDPEDRAFRQKYLYKRDELSNALLFNDPAYAEGVRSPSDNILKFPETFYRDVDSTFHGEWGNLEVYKGAVVEHGAWTSEIHSPDRAYRISYHGGLLTDKMGFTDPGLVCRGE